MVFHVSSLIHKTASEYQFKQTYLATILIMHTHIRKYDTFQCHSRNPPTHSFHSKCEHNLPRVSWLVPREPNRWSPLVYQIPPKSMLLPPWPNPFLQSIRLWRDLKIISIGCLFLHSQLQLSARFVVRSCFVHLSGSGQPKEEKYIILNFYGLIEFAKKYIKTRSCNKKWIN